MSFYSCWYDEKVFGIFERNFNDNKVSRKHYFEFVLEQNFFRLFTHIINNTYKYQTFRKGHSGESYRSGSQLIVLAVLLANFIDEFDFATVILKISIGFY